ncbi:hypothetical protein [Leptospira wolffii]|uniref:hypothetical protein n=1 Tax=Leptospira wolffii TaxID=409998 RepID=UPI00058D79F3|nr:hypothetical protein [Leptospira wolffii]
MSPIQPNSKRKFFHSFLSSKIGRFLIFLLVSLLTDCATVFINAIKCANHGGCDTRPMNIPFEAVTLSIDGAIANAMALGATAPSFGWIYGGTALLIFIISTISNLK